MTTRRRDNGQTDNATRFDFHNRSEPETGLAAADQLITAPRIGDAFTFTPYQIGIDDRAITFIEVTSSATDAIVEVKAVRRLNLGDHFVRPWLLENQNAVIEFFEDRYRADVDFGDGDYDPYRDVELRFWAHTTAPISRGDVHALVIEQTRIGQFGEEDADLYENMMTFLNRNVVIASRDSLYASQKLTQEDIAAAIADRSGRRELSDTQALAIGHQMYFGKYPTWSRFGRTGVADKTALHDELLVAYNTEDARVRQYANMMFTYLLYGGDND